MKIRRRALTLIAAFGLATSLPAFATRKRSLELALEAKLALDAYFGREAQLALAAKLLTRAMAEDNANAEAFVQAARLRAKSGVIHPSTFLPGVLEANGMLLDRALALEPKHAKARVLKAEYFHYMGDYEAERSQLDSAMRDGVADVWLLMGYARHFEQQGNYQQAYAYYDQVRARGVGKTLEQRNAVMGALTGIAMIAAMANDLTTLRGAAEQARKERDPRDAWTLSNISDFALNGGLFDEAIVLAREALATRSYGAARLALAAALYGKASVLKVGGQAEAANALVKEARGLGFGKAAILDRYDRNDAHMTLLYPALEALLD